MTVVATLLSWTPRTTAACHKVCDKEEKKNVEGKKVPFGTVKEDFADQGRTEGGHVSWKDYYVLDAGLCFLLLLAELLDER